jgi:hypothetical protein
LVDETEFYGSRRRGSGSTESSFRLFDATTDPVPWGTSQFINGVKSTVGAVIFTGGHRKLFHHPESQISLSSSLETETETDCDSTTSSYKKNKSNLY